MEEEPKTPTRKTVKKAGHSKKKSISNKLEKNSRSRKELDCLDSSVMSEPLNIEIMTNNEDVEVDQ